MKAEENGGRKLINKMKLENYISKFKKKKIIWDEKSIFQDELKSRNNL